MKSSWRETLASRTVSSTLEYEAAYEGRVDFGFQDQPPSGLLLDQITETGLQCRSLSLSKRPFDLPQGPKELAQGPATPDQRPQAARALDVP